MNDHHHAFGKAVKVDGDCQTRHGNHTNHRNLTAPHFCGFRGFCGDVGATETRATPTAGNHAERGEPTMNYHHETRTLYAAWPLNDRGDIEAGLIIGWEHVDDDDGPYLTPWVGTVRGALNHLSIGTTTYMDPVPVTYEHVANGTLVIGTDLADAVEQARDR